LPANGSCGRGSRVERERIRRGEDRDAVARSGRFRPIRRKLVSGLYRLRNITSKEQWIDALKTVGAPLGKLVSRQLKSAQYSTALPNNRPGEFMVLQFITNYEKAPAMLETVITVLEKNGTWRVTGYYIKRAS